MLAARRIRVFGKQRAIVGVGHHHEPLAHGADRRHELRKRCGLEGRLRGHHLAIGPGERDAASLDQGDADVGIGEQRIAWLSVTRFPTPCTVRVRSRSIAEGSAAHRRRDWMTAGLHDQQHRRRAKHQDRSLAHPPLRYVLRAPARFCLASVSLARFANSARTHW